MQYNAVIHHRKQDTYAGAVTWRLVRTDEGLKIKSKRVDLLNADAPLDCDRYDLSGQSVSS